MNPKIKQVKPELRWRFPNDHCDAWSFTLYIAYPNGRLEGFYDKTASGQPVVGYWAKPHFNRDNIVFIEQWEFITEL